MDAGKEPRPTGRTVSFRCALVLGVLLCVSILGVVAFMAYCSTAGNGSASVTASVCDPEVWVASVNQGSRGRGVLKPQLSGPVTCRAGCEADADCVSYELSNSACRFISDSFVELQDEPGTTSYRRQRVCVWGSATCIFTYEGRYDLDDKTNPPLTTEPSLESCLRRCLNCASVCHGLSYNLHAGSGDCEPRSMEADLSTRTKQEDYVEYTMACTGVTTAISGITTPTTRTTPTTTITPTRTTPTTTTTPTSTTPTPTPTTTTNKNCRGDWIRHDGSCYRFFNIKVLWNTSRDACMAEQAHLMTIDSLEEEAYLKNTYMVPYVQKKTSRPRIWNGGAYSSGTWRWITTLEPVCTCYQWADRGPKSTSEGFCLAYHSKNNVYYGQIYDFSCLYTHPYLCEYETN